MRELIRLERDHKGSAQYLEAAIARIRQFSHLAGGKPDALVATVWKLYGAADKGLGLWVVLEDGEIIGHMLVLLRTWDDEWVGWVTHLEMDAPHQLGRAWIALGLGALEGWVHEVNATPAAASAGIKVERLMMSTFRDADAWARAFGFAHHRALCARKVAG